MKKILLLTISILILGAGCSTNQDILPETSTKQNTDTPSTTTSSINTTNTTTTINTTTNINTPSTTTKTNLNNFPPKADNPQGGINKQNMDSKTDNSAVTTDILQKYNQAVLKTNLGDITIKFYNQDSPNTVRNFLTLAEKSFYNNTKFHRVIKNFMIQGGDPLSKESNRSMHGTGGPGYKFKDEFNSHKLVKGSLAMANSGPDTNGSQFFIVTAPATSWLDGKHTNFGYITAGMDVITKIENLEVDQRDNPINEVKIISIELKK